MEFPDIAAAVTIVATVIGSTVRVMLKLNQIDRELFELRRDFLDTKTRLNRLEERSQ
jgi:hypothetical protein